MNRNTTLMRQTTTTDDLTALAHRAPATNDLCALAVWLRAHGAAHLSPIEQIELAERLITRRRFLIGVGALVLAGCGAPSAGAPTATVASDGYPRTITDDSGTAVTIPARPQRVAVTDPLTGFEALLALGVAPVLVGVRSFFDTYTGEELGLWPWQQATLTTLGAAPERIPADDGVSVEAIARSNPDLVVGMAYWVESGGSGLRALAPTIQVPFEFPDAVRLLGDVFGLEERAEQVLADFDAQIAAALDGLVSGSPTIATIYPYPDGTAYVAGSANDQPIGLLLRAGFRLVDAIAALEKDSAGFNLPISAERLDLLQAADVIVITAFSTEAADALEANPLFTILPAVQAGRVFRLEQGPIAQASAILSPNNFNTVLPFIREVAALAP